MGSDHTPGTIRRMTCIGWFVAIFRPKKNSGTILDCIVNTDWTILNTEHLFICYSQSHILCISPVFWSVSSRQLCRCCLEYISASVFCANPSAHKFIFYPSLFWFPNSHEQSNDSFPASMHDKLSAPTCYFHLHKHTKIRHTHKQLISLGNFISCFSWQDGSSLESLRLSEEHTVISHLIICRRFIS